MQITIGGESFDATDKLLNAIREMFKKKAPKADAAGTK